MPLQHWEFSEQPAPGGLQQRPVVALHVWFVEQQGVSALHGWLVNAQQPLGLLAEQFWPEKQQAFELVQENDPNGQKQPPPPQRPLLGQVSPHAPQLFSSVFRSTHCPPQSVVPAGHSQAHVAGLTTWPPVHVTQSPLQTSVPAGHAHLKSGEQKREQHWASDWQGLPIARHFAARASAPTIAKDAPGGATDDALEQGSPRGSACEHARNVVKALVIHQSTSSKTNDGDEPEARPLDGLTVAGATERSSP